jgi:hypothetical protein
VPICRPPPHAVVGSTPASMQAHEPPCHCIIEVRVDRGGTIAVVKTRAVRFMVTAVEEAIRVVEFGDERSDGGNRGGV